MMSKFAELIRGKGLLEMIQNAVDKACVLAGKSPQKSIDSAVRDILENEFHKDEELGEAFAEYAYELGLDAIVKELHITFNPDSDASRNISDHDRMIHSISELLALLMISSCR